MLLQRELGPASCRVFNRSSRGIACQVPGGVAIPWREMARELRPLATWETCSAPRLTTSPLRSQQPVTSPCFCGALRGTGCSSPASAPFPYSTALTLPALTASLHTWEGSSPWAAAQPASTALHQAETWAGKLPGLKWCGFNEIFFFYDLCSKLPVLGIVFE